MRDLTTTEAVAITAYIECALWSTCDFNEEGPLDENYGPDDLAPSAYQELANDVLSFLQENESDLADMDPTQIGHDFWLTRNRHGAGFWDRGLGKLGDDLTEAAHAYGSCDLYVGDDKKVYVA